MVSWCILKRYMYVTSQCSEDYKVFWKDNNFHHMSASFFGFPFLANPKIEEKKVLTNNLIWKGCCWLACTHTGYSISLVPVTVFLPRKVSKSLSLSSLCQYCLLCMYASESDERPDRLLMFDLSLSGNYEPITIKENKETSFEITEWTSFRMLSTKSLLYILVPFIPKT